MANIGDTFERDGATYTVVNAEAVGPNTARNGISRVLGVTRGKGKTIYMAWEFNDGVIGKLMSMGRNG